ncbi:MAG: hypothetical protein ACLPJW_07135, partial [Rhodomicrobium sp.]
FAKTALAPICWKAAGGFMVLNAVLNWLWVMTPEPRVVTLANTFDIFCPGEALALAPDMVWGAWLPWIAEIGAVTVTSFAGDVMI